MTTYIIKEASKMFEHFSISRHAQERLSERFKIFDKDQLTKRIRNSVRGTRNTRISNIKNIRYIECGDITYVFKNIKEKNEGENRWLLLTVLYTKKNVYKQ